LNKLAQPVDVRKPRDEGHKSTRLRGYRWCTGQCQKKREFYPFWKGSLEYPREKTLE